MSPLFPLLGLIFSADAYGYELKRSVDGEFAPSWQIDFAQLYRSLAKLSAQGFIRVTVAPGQGGPPRKLYHATPQGRAAFLRWLNQASESPTEFRVKARLAERLGLDGALPLWIAGSDDPLLAHLAQGAHAFAQVMGSTAGLVALASNQAEVAGAHLRAPDSNEYNITYVQHLVPELDVLLVRFAVREYGLMVARDNPKGVRSVRDLARADVRLVNRTPGAGARLWLQQHLRTARLNPAVLQRALYAAATYDAVADAIAGGRADVGPGIRAAAMTRGLEFIPLGEEQFDLVMPRALYESPRGDALLARLHDKTFHTYASTVPGYDLAHSGQVRAEIKFGSRRL